MLERPTRAQARILLPLAALTLAVALPVAVALAAQHVVSQRSRAFDVDALTVARGDSIVFANGDLYGHNVYSDSPAGPFDIGLQGPGEHAVITFKNAGDYDIRCRIHPKMRMRVTVRE